MRKQTFKCGYCGATVKSGVKQCPKCRKFFKKNLNVGWSFAPSSFVTRSILMIFLGYVIALTKLPMLSLLIVLIVSFAVPLFLKKKRAILLYNLITTPFLLIGYVLGTVTFKGISKIYIGGYLVLALIVYAAYLGVRSLRRIAKFQQHDKLPTSLGYVTGLILYIPVGLLFIWLNIQYNIRNNVSEFTFIVFGVVLVVLGIFSVYYSSKIP